MDILSHNRIKVSHLKKIFSLVFLLSALSSNAFAMDYGGIGVRPAYPQEGNDRSQSIFVHTLNPSEVKDEGVLVVNNTADTKTLLVYAVDSTPSTDGGFACKQISESKNDVGSWITLDKEEVTVEAGKNVLVPFKIRVPSNAAAGEHDGCVITQEKLEKSGVTSGVSLSFRTGLRVAITIPGDVVRKLQVTDFKVLPKDDGSFIMQLKARNPGNVSIDADIGVVNRYFFGLVNGETYGGQYSILREDTKDWNFELPKPFWGGWYRASYSIKYDDSKDAAIGVVTGAKLTELTGNSDWFYSPPTNTAKMIEITFLLFVIFGLFLLGLSFKRKIWVRKSWIDYEIVADETITSVAEKFDIAWKILAKANKLKAPYELKPGEKIKVPPTK